MDDNNINQQLYTYNNNGVPNPEVSKQKGFAIASMVCGITSIIGICFIGLGFILSILGIIFGCIALSTMNKTNDKTGKGMAIAGLITGIIFLVVLIIILVVLIAIYFNQPEFDAISL